jgi:myo-inositol-1(or 4)-monophosphatase
MPTAARKVQPQMMIDQTNGAELIEPVGLMLRQAGHLISDRTRSPLQIEAKGTANYVTEIDLAVQQQILDRLAVLTPGFAVITEESSVNRFVFDRPTWILDPVDGTTNLMRHYQHASISLALAVQGELQLAFVYNPYLQELFQAEAGRGAWLNGRSISVNPFTNLSDCLVGFGTTPYARAEVHRTFDLVERVFKQSLEVRRSGSAALDLAYVACGRLDAFFELSLQPWDYAAGCLLVREAGGLVSTWLGSDPDLGQAGSILATNGKVHDQLLAMMR